MEYLSENTEVEKKKRIVYESDVWSIVKGKKKRQSLCSKTWGITSSDILPKQLSMAKLLKGNNVNDINKVKYISTNKIRLDVFN